MLIDNRSMSSRITRSNSSYISPVNYVVQIPSRASISQIRETYRCDNIKIDNDNIARPVPRPTNTNSDKTIANMITADFTGQLKGRWSDNSETIRTLLQNLRCKTLTSFRFYKDVSLCRVMELPECNSAHWKSKFIDGLPSLFVERVRKAIKGDNPSINYDNFTDGKLISSCVQEGLSLCNEIKLNQQIKRHHLNERKQLGEFCEQFAFDVPKQKSKDKEYIPKKKKKSSIKDYEKWKKKRINQNTGGFQAPYFARSTESFIAALQDGRNHNWKKSLIGTIQTSLAYGSVYFNAYPNLQISLQDDNSLSALMLNVKLHGYDYMSGTEVVCICYRIYYKLLHTLNPMCKVVTRRPIKWEEIDFPQEWVIENATQPRNNINTNVSEIEQLNDGTVKIKFSEPANMMDPPWITKARGKGSYTRGRGRSSPSPSSSRSSYGSSSSSTPIIQKGGMSLYNLNSRAQEKASSSIHLEDISERYNTSENVYNFSKMIIKHVIHIEDWGISSMTERQFNLNKVMIFANSIPNWFLNWWSYHGPIIKILPEPFLKLYKEWVKVSPNLNKLYHQEHICYFQQIEQIYFFIEFSVPWIHKWVSKVDFTEEQIPYLYKTYYNNFWDKLMKKDPQTKYIYGQKLLDLIMKTIHDYKSIPNKGIMTDDSTSVKHMARKISNRNEGEQNEMIMNYLERVKKKILLNISHYAKSNSSMRSETSKDMHEAQPYEEESPMDALKKAENLLAKLKDKV
ncbi:hypothetical protein H5410_040352 [Solanum commersonii]|uniref:DUF7746 domain-containing protein n=1 Tax=Solanum commersonii TaxID=4109 RepID=A0A9J5XS93_SOLCO|nr:hypothetical protein H5410_040352 [Solanum commersonii]